MTDNQKQIIACIKGKTRIASVKFRDDLTTELGLTWSDIREDIMDLEDQGYLDKDRTGLAMLDFRLSHKGFQYIP